jgi:hypothetical protein
MSKSTRNECYAISKNPSTHNPNLVLLQLHILRFGFLQDRDIGVGVLPEGKGSRHWGSPIFFSIAAYRGSECRPRH